MITFMQWLSTLCSWGYLSKKEVSTIRQFATTDDGPRIFLLPTMVYDVEGGRGFGSHTGRRDLFATRRERYRDKDGTLPHKKLCMLNNAENIV